MDPRSDRSADGGVAVRFTKAKARDNGGAAWRALNLTPLAALLLATTGCQSLTDDTPVIVDVVGFNDQIINPLRDDQQPASQAVLGATAQGLVAYDGQGEVVAALAESWIVTDDGQSYIFRLGRHKWADGTPVKADLVVTLLKQRMRATPLLMAGLEPEIRAMTDRVIEVRLETALPTFLQLLANPRLGLLSRTGGSGPYASRLHLDRLYLRPLAEEVVDSDEAPAEIRAMDRRTIETGRAALALARFQIGSADLVLGGRFQDLLLLRGIRLGTNELHADPVRGLFGLAIVGKSRFLADRDVRDALSRAIDRDSFAGALNLQGWTAAITPLPGNLDLSRSPTSPDWRDTSLADRVSAARTAVDRWRGANGEPPILRIALPAGAGATLLFRQIAMDFSKLGVTVDRVAIDADADLRLIDSVAPFDSALWYLGRLDCDAGVVCDPDASAYLISARSAANATEQAAMLSEAERLIVAHAGYIPLGQPIRWSLVSRRLTGFQPSPRGIHPLNKLIGRPNQQ
jgi:peptide/nickel transport system substrate-binding protein